MDTLKGNIEKALKANLEGFDFVTAMCDGITMDTAEGRLASTLFDALNNWQDCRGTLIRKVTEAQRSAERMFDHLTTTMTGANFYTSFTPNPENEVKAIAEKTAMIEAQIAGFLYIVGIEGDDRKAIFNKLAAVRK